MKVHLYAICWNEQDLLPYFLRHYEQFCDVMFIYDNMSNDGSRSMLAAHPKVVLRDYDSGGEIRDDLYLEIKNNAWKQSRGEADWIVVVDIDEFVHHPNMKTYLGWCQERGIHVIKPFGYLMISNEMPSGSGQLYDELDQGAPDENQCAKSVIFSPNRLEEIGYSPGAHSCLPKEASSEDGVLIHRSRNCRLLHYKLIGGPQRIVRRFEQFKNRLSQINKERKWGIQYTFSVEELLALHEYLWTRASSVFGPIEDVRSRYFECARKTVSNIPLFSKQKDT